MATQSYNLSTVTPPPEEASQHVLDAAEQLFLARGYAQTKLRDLATQLNIKPASLYYHAPGGKEELWHRVMDRLLKRHREQLTQAAAQAGPNLRSQLRAMGDWLISQPLVNPVSILSADPGTKGRGQAVSTADQLYEGLMMPVVSAVRAAAERGELKPVEPDLVAGVFVTSINGMIPLSADNQLPTSLQTLVYQLVDILMDGIERR